MLYNAFQSARQPKSAPSIYIPMQFPGPTRLSIPNCVSIISAVLTQLTAENPGVHRPYRILYNVP